MSKEDQSTMAQNVEAPSKKPYSAPQLRRIGSIASLTLSGGSVRISDNPVHTSKRRG
jgi:hypothetical protein